MHEFNPFPSREGKLNILYIFPGPVYNPDNPIYQERFLRLSAFLQGYILTTSSKEERLRIGNFSYLSMQGERFGANFFFIYFCLKQALKIRMRKERIDCIVTYDPLKSGWIGGLLKKLFGAKLIVEVNGVYTSPIVWETAKKNLLTKLKRILSPIIMRKTFKKADGIYLLFPSQIDTFKNISNRKIVASYPCWVPTSSFSNIGDRKEILLVGFPFKIKGVDILIEAFKRISHIHPEWSLKILGWYPDRQELEKAIGSHPRIFHHPPVPYAQMPSHIGECGILAQPSRTEAMGRALVEAAAAGKPRIGSNVDGIPTVINDEVDGYLIKPEDIEDLASKLNKLMNDQSLRKKLGHAAQMRARREFSEDMYIKNTIEFYNKVHDCNNL